MEKNYYSHLLQKVKYGGADSDRHLLTMFSLSVSINAKKILELGVRDGNTTLPFLLAAKETGGMVHSVDLDPTRFQCPDDLRIYWKFYQSDALKWLEQNNTQYDIVYVDDWHAYSHVKQELEMLESMISPSGLILLHDLMYSNAQPDYRSNLTPSDPQWADGGPYRAVAELDPEKWEWSTIPINHGLTILRKKSGRIIS